MSVASISRRIRKPYTIPATNLEEKDAASVHSTVSELQDKLENQTESLKRDISEYKETIENLQKTVKDLSTQVEAVTKLASEYKSAFVDLYEQQEKMAKILKSLTDDGETASIMSIMDN